MLLALNLFAFNGLGMATGMKLAKLFHRKDLAVLKILDLNQGLKK